MSTRFRWLAVAVIATAAIAVSASPASASPYSKAPPRFDGLMMLRVAYGYNVSTAYDLEFPARSDEACEIAGVSVTTFIGKDHIAWSHVPENHTAIQAVYDEAIAANPGDGRAVPCYMLHSQSLAELVAGLPRVWPATLKPNFNQLRKALKRGDCRGAEKRMRKYPRVDLPRPRIRRAVKVAAGGCKRP